MVGELDRHPPLLANQKALVNATNVIQRFCTFVDSDGEAVSLYNPESETDEGIPRLAAPGLAAMRRCIS